MVTPVPVSRVQHALIHCKPKKRKAMSSYLSAVEKKEIITTLGDPACLLMDFYLSKSSVPDYTFKDEAVVRAFGWTARKVKSIRQKLTRAGWYYQKRSTTRGSKVTEVFVATYLGKEKVKEIKTKYGE